MSSTLNHTIRRRLLVPILALAVAPVTFGQAAPRPAYGFQSAAAKRQARAITGKVLVEGSPAADVHVTVTSSAQVTASTGISALMARGNEEDTADDGSFSVEGLAPGAYTISVSTEGYIVDSGLLNEDGKPIFYRPGDTAIIRMIKGGVITGKVTDAQGQPLIQAPVTAVRLRDERGRAAGAVSRISRGMGSSQTDDRGIYRLYGLQPGAYVVS